MLSKLFSAVCSIGLFVAAAAAYAGDPRFPAHTIPDSLKEKAHAVKRWEELRFTLSGEGEARLSRHYVITVLDGYGDKYASMLEYYDKLREIRSISGVMYDANGKQLKKLKQSDIKDLSGVDHNSLMTDTRIKKHAFYNSVYPYTVEYEVEIRYNCSFVFPKWIPQSGQDLAVEQSRMLVNVPQDYQLRYRNFRYAGEPQQVTEKGTRNYVWEARQLKALPDETACPEWGRRTTAVWLAPGAFEMEKYKGSMNSWEEFGSFVYSLNRGRDQLPDAVKQTVHTLTDGLSDPSEKIKRLYRYLQQNTRYVSVQLGIGGWQTFDAAYVANNGYGDCKALSNYMYALLKEAGIPSYYTLVHAGYGETSFETDFPSTQFNHVILCVPLGKDTTWLECTSPYMPAGYLSGFTAGRPVLLVTENGGRLAATPVYGMEQNQQLRRIEARVAADGNVQAQVFTHYTGQQQDELHARLHALSREKLLESVRSSISLPSYDVDKYACTEQAGGVPAIDEQLNITARNYAAISGRRMFLEPNILNKSTWLINKEEQRVSDIYLTIAYRDVDTVLIILPEGYAPESLPKEVKLQTRFGNYAATISIQGNTLTYIRTIAYREGSFPAAAFTELEQFQEAIYKADRSRIVLVKTQ
jgi:transglutaminase-like putative cysteine protease